MDWLDIAAIVFASVTVNHLGLTGAVIAVFWKRRRTLPVVSCPRCLAFWGVLAYGLARLMTGMSGDGLATALPSFLPRLLAISILCSYLAVWLELLEGIIDKLYDYVYRKIYPTADTPDADTERA